MIGHVIIFTLALSASCSQELYRKTLEQGLDSVPLNVFQKFVIPEGQCSGLIDFGLCDLGGVPKRASVSVLDTEAYPSITFSNSSLAPIVIQRKPGRFGCVYKAVVELRVGCVAEPHPSETTSSPAPLPVVSSQRPLRSLRLGHKFLSALKG